MPPRVSMVVCVCLLIAAAAVASPPIRFPDDMSVIDVKRDCGAKGDGTTDDTDALQRGLDESCGLGAPSTKVVFLPPGVYRVTRSLIVKASIGPWLHGASRDTTIIKLDDGIRDCTAVLRTHPRESGKNSADWFMRNLRNFTIDVGNNPETDGIRYFATNTGCLQNVRIIGRGKVGLHIGFLDQSGPSLTQDVEIQGFETGILCQWTWCQTFSRIVLRDCRKVGLVVSATPAAVEDLTVENTPLPVHCQLPNNWGHWSGVVALVGGRFRGQGVEGPAIRNEGILYARNLDVQGYQHALTSVGIPAPIPGPRVSEWHSPPRWQVWDDSATRALHLPIQREPEIPWENDPDRWVCANDYGARHGDNRDDTAALQKAIDTAAAAGKTTVYLRGIGGTDPNWYTLDGPVRVHGSVRHIIGLGFGRILRGQAGAFVVGDDAAPVVKFQYLDAFGGPPVWIENASRDRAVVIDSCGVHIRGTGTGPIFVTNCPAQIKLTQPGQQLWARQLNPEGDTEQALVDNAGANLWILGMKCEGRGTRLRTAAGGRSEVFGTFIYGPGVKEDDPRPLFDVDNASFSLLGIREIAFGGHTFTNKVREKRGEEIRVLEKSAAGGWMGLSHYSGWRERR